MYIGSLRASISVCVGCPKRRRHKRQPRVSHLQFRQIARVMGRRSATAMITVGSGIKVSVSSMSHSS